jgi:hypothetical protein
MLHAEHVVKQNGASHIKPNVCPSEPEVAPSFTIDYGSQLVETVPKACNEKLAILTDITRRKILIRILELAVLAATGSSRVIQLAPSGRNKGFEVCTTRQPTRGVEDAQLRIRTMYCSAV